MKYKNKLMCIIGYEELLEKTKERDWKGEWVKQMDCGDGGFGRFFHL